MKLPSLIASLLLTVASFGAMAATDRSYYVTELASQQKFDVYNDGRNTFLQSIPGLIVSGATADGEFFIVKGVPSSIRGFMNGKPITIVRGTPPALPPIPADKTVNADLKRLTDELTLLTSKAPALAKSRASTSTAPAPGTNADIGAIPTAGPGAQKGPVPSQGNATLPVAVGMKSKLLTAADVMVYSVTPAQHDLRSVIDIWAKIVGWTSVWDIDRDIPINMADSKENDFRSAVRRVLAATEFGDLPAKPCFYSNNVVRIVRKTTKCNPNE